MIRFASIISVKRLEFRWWSRSSPEPTGPLVLDGLEVPIVWRKNPLAKRYRLFIDRSGNPRVTIPRRGNAAEARRFAEGHRDWINSQLAKFRERRLTEQHWDYGTPILFRGQQVLIERSEDEVKAGVRLGSEDIPVRDSAVPGQSSFRLAIEAHLRRLAHQELPIRVRALATLHACTVIRVSVRNQRTRWGSCSRKGTISLNWRLIQVPDSVRDYIILHELMHLREMNHSARFWNHVASVCPDFRESEAWLKAHPGMLASID